MIIENLLAEIMTVSSEYNENNGILLEDTLQVKFDMPVIESFDELVFESISEEAIENTPISKDLEDYIFEVSQYMSDVYNKHFA